MFRLLKGAWFWTAGIALTIYAVSAVAVMYFISVVLLRGPRDGRKLHHIATFWGRSVVNITPGWKVEVKGREHLPPSDQPMVLVSNHESMADIFVMYFLRVQFRWLAKEEVFRIPFLGNAMRRIGYVPVRRGSRESHAAALRESEQRIRDGLSMLFFPEGTRSEDGRIKDFKLGAFKVARDTQTPMLPIALHGARELLPKHGRIPQTSTVRIEVLPPVPPPRPDEDLDTYAASMRQQIVEAHARLV